VSSTCPASQRRRCTLAAEAIVDHDHVVAVDVLEHDNLPRWSLEIVCDVPHGPPAVLSALGDQGLALRTAHPQGIGYHLVAKP